MLSSGNDFHPDRDWRLLLGAFLLLCSVAFAAAVFLYRGLNTLEAVGEERMIGDPRTELDRASLDAIAKALVKKEERFKGFLVAPPAIVDPAL